MNFIRVLRDFKANLIKNLTFTLLVALSVTVIVGFNRSMGSFLDGVYELRAQCHMEDGDFALFQPLSKSKLHQLNNQFQMTIEEYQQTTIDLSPKSSDDSIDLKVMSLDKTINEAGLIKGRLPEAANEIAIDPKFAAAHDYPIGSTITLSNINYTVVGYAISPDYIYTLKETSDLLNNPEAFGVGYMTESGYAKIEDDQPVSTVYCYLDPEHHSDALKAYLNDHAQLNYFMEASDNARITTVINDVNSPKLIALIMGLLLIVIVAFIISISIKNTIAKESQTIGILYSQGFVKRELLSYYLTLPCLLVLLGILIGYPAGVVLSPYLTVFADFQYTLPPVTFKSSPFIYFAGIFLPLFASISITYHSLAKALNKTPISLLRGQHSSNHVSKLEKHFTFKHLSFFRRFRLKDMLREKNSMLSLFGGVFISMFILITGLYFRNSVFNYIHTLTDGYPYECLYVFKSNADLNTYSQQGEQIALSSFKFSSEDQLKNVSLYGLPSNSEFFHIPELASLKDNEILMAPCMNAKFHLQVGDTLDLIDNKENKTYTVKIAGYCNYDFGQYFYTTIDCYDRILDKHALPYNALITHAPLKVNSDKVYSLITKNSVITSTSNILNLINSFTSIMIAAGIIILMIVIYLIMNMILEKSSINISMVKIFGYNPKEINRLYLSGNVFWIILAFLPAIAAAYKLCQCFYQAILSDMDNYIAPYISPKSLLIGFALMLFGYWASCFLLKRKINQIALTQALKNRE